MSQVPNLPHAKPLCMVGASGAEERIAAKPDLWFGETGIPYPIATSRGRRAKAACKANKATYKAKMPSKAAASHCCGLR